MASDLETRCINALRMLSLDAVERAKSGHPGLPMGMAAAAYVLWTEHLRHNPRHPAWWNRDRFVLSAGHGSMLLYSLLHLTGYDLPLEELKRFRQWGSRTPGHPERGETPGVETTTGPLGQGISTAVGLALAERHLAAQFNRPGFDLIDHRTFVIASDGDLMEGISSEASSLAGHWRLGKLIVLYDNNHVTIDGSTELAFTEDVLGRYRAYGWQVVEVEDGNDLPAIRQALEEALLDPRPSLISLRTLIGYGSPLQGTSKAHSDPMGPENVAKTRETLGWPYSPFEIPEEVYAVYRQALQRGEELEAAWNALYQSYRAQFPELASELARRMEGRLPPLEPARWAERFEGPISTRAASGKVLEELTAALPELVGGSADLTPSNNTRTPSLQEFSAERPEGRYLHFGVREHAMGAILNGLNLHGGLRAYGGTFLVFSDYLRPALRLAALMHAPTLFVFTHDSIALGEDGPTHQPIEHLMSLRAIPNLWVVRPADAREVAYAWKLALERKDGPTALILTRQSLPLLAETQSRAEGLLKGGYLLAPIEAPQASLVATGSEVALALKAQSALQEQGIRAQVVSLPCWEAFEAQPEEYRRAVLPPGLPTVAVEAGATLGWYRYAQRVVGIDRFGASAPYPEVYERLGFQPERVVAEVRALLGL